MPFSRPGPSTLHTAAPVAAARAGASGQSPRCCA
nr:MAG TPA: Serine dehydratase beta chain [Caudoviricetes sp.]